MSKSRVFFFFQSAFAFLFCTLLPVKAVIKHLLHEHYQTQAAVLHSRRGLQMLFQHKFDPLCRERGSPLFPHPSRRHRIAQGILQLGRAGLEPLQCVKLFFQNVTSILSTAPMARGSTLVSVASHNAVKHVCYECQEAATVSHNPSLYTSVLTGCCSPLPPDAV